MLRKTAPKPTATTTRHAKKLRKEMTLPEVILWRALRVRPGDFKFRRQHPTGPYVLDFFCSDARLAIEVVGEAHSRGNRPERDAARDAWLEAQGIRTLRVAASDILRDADSVLRLILQQCRERLPLHHPASPDGPPPRAKLGED